mmetsp:Transcript_42190/g.122031  ORF Transcript_42190/g.122031 Transcript_42190/m.122031 type:complete len:84 (-) Transcript_42190:274-525(-)
MGLQACQVLQAWQVLRGLSDQALVHQVPVHLAQPLVYQLPVQLACPMQAVLLAQAIFMGQVPDQLVQWERPVWWNQLVDRPLQ